MQDKPFFDSNVLIYAFTEAGEKTRQARLLLSAGGVVSVHALNESANVLLRKLRASWPQVRSILKAIVDTCPDPLPLTMSTHESALRLGECYGYSIYDSLIIASALEAGCTILYTEDLQHGQTIDGLRIENPFLNL